MKKMENKKQRVQKDGVKLLPPKMFRRQGRARKNRDFKRRNDGQAVGRMNFFQLLHKGSPIFTDKRRKKFKGWQRENRRYRKAA